MNARQEFEAERRGWVAGGWMSSTEKKKKVTHTHSLRLRRVMGGMRQTRRSQMSLARRAMANESIKMTKCKINKQQTCAAAASAGEDKVKRGWVRGVQRMCRGSKTRHSPLCSGCSAGGSVVCACRGSKEGWMEGGHGVAREKGEREKKPRIRALGSRAGHSGAAARIHSLQPWN